MKNASVFKCIHCKNLFKVISDDKTINLRGQLYTTGASNTPPSTLSTSSIPIVSDSLISSSMISPDNTSSLPQSASLLSKSQIQSQTPSQQDEEEFNTCINCYEKLIKENEKELAEYKEKVINLQEISKELNDKINTKEFTDTSKYNIESITTVAANIDEQIQSATQDEKEQQTRFWQLMNDYKKIKQKETCLWKELNNLEKDITSTNKETIYLLKEIDLLQIERTRLINTNIYNTLFKISFEDNIPTIGGCRMLFTSPKVTNDEVNCGWGYIVFLTQLLAMKLDYSFKEYKLKAYGNYSEITSLVTHKIVSFEYIGIDSIDTVNQAMIMYLAALKEFTDELLVLKKMILRKGIDFIFTIKENSINDMSIIITTNTDSYENWRTCLKYILMILKSITIIALDKESNSLKEIIAISNKLKRPISNN